MLVGGIVEHSAMRVVVQAMAAASCSCIRVREMQFERPASLLGGASMHATIDPCGYQRREERSVKSSGQANVHGYCSTAERNGPLLEGIPDSGQGAARISASRWKYHTGGFGT